MSRDDHLAAIVAECRERHERGEPVDVEALAAAHPDLAAELRSCLGLADLIRGPFEAPDLPQEFDDFRIVREIGRGGMGVVFEAEQISLRRPVAIKTLFPQLTVSEEAVARFRLEAQAAAQLRHPNIVQVLSMGRCGDTHYYAMELVDGASLREVVDELRAARGTTDRANGSSRWTDERLGGRPGESGYYRGVAELLADAGTALHAAHEIDLIHRDVKPGNLLLGSRNRLQVADFGLVRIASVDDRMTTTGAFVGTPAYMSPEQLLGRSLDRRTDVYSLGAVLFELLTLESPAALRGATSVRDRDPSRVDARVPKPLAAITRKAVAPVEERYPSAERMALDLQAFSDGAPIRVDPSPLRRRWVRATAVVAAVAGLGAIAAGRLDLHDDTAGAATPAAVATDAPESPPEPPLSRRVAGARGDAHERNGDAEAALSVFRRGRVEHPDWVYAHRRAASLFSALGRPEEAAEAARRALELGVGDLHENRALLAAIAGDEEAARDAIESAPPPVPQGRLIRARAYAVLGDADRCVRELQTAAEAGVTRPAATLLPSLHPGLRGRADYEDVVSRIWVAEPSVDSASTNTPRLTVKQVRNEIHRLSRDGRYEQALPILEQARADYPDNAFFAKAQAFYLDTLGRSDEAAEPARAFFANALRWSSYDRAHLEVLAGRPEVARELLRSADAPKKNELHRAARVHYGLGDDATCLRMLRECIAQGVRYRAQGYSPGMFPRLVGDPDFESLVDQVWVGNSRSAD